MGRASCLHFSFFLRELVYIYICILYRVRITQCRQHPVQNWSDESKAKALAVALHGDEEDVKAIEIDLGSI